MRSIKMCVFLISRQHVNKPKTKGIFFVNCSLDIKKNNKLICLNLDSAFILYSGNFSLYALYIALALVWCLSQCFAIPFFLLSLHNFPAAVSAHFHLSVQDHDRDIYYRYFYSTTKTSEMKTVNWNRSSSRKIISIVFGVSKESARITFFLKHRISISCILSRGFNHSQFWRFTQRNKYFDMDIKECKFSIRWHLNWANAIGHGVSLSIFTSIISYAWTCNLIGLF